MKGLLGGVWEEEHSWQRSSTCKDRKDATPHRTSRAAGPLWLRAGYGRRGWVSGSTAELICHALLLKGMGGHQRILRRT